MATNLIVDISMFLLNIIFAREISYASDTILTPSLENRDCQDPFKDS